MPEQRAVSYQALPDLLDDINNLSENEAPTSTGGWTAAQNVMHVSLLINDSLDGFTVKAPLPFRLLGPFLKGRVLNKGLKPGIKIPAGQIQERFVPSKDTTWEAAYALLNKCVQRIQNGEKMIHPSPLFGKMSHEEWTTLHCKHAAMHFGFLHPASS